MSKDPVVEEIHQIRAELLAEHGGMDGYLRHLEQLQLELKDRIVRREPRKTIMPTNRAAS
ncbi:MAG: hypothetical protein JWO56_3105 [Acidobacteria bacterium]|nr:hypothetical protein [Acidobacteriota bacterium]